MIDRTSTAPLVLLVAIGVSGCGGGKLPCAKVAWAEDDGSLRIRVLFEREECKSLATLYGALTKAGTQDRESVQVTTQAVAFLTDEKSSRYLEGSAFIDSVRGDFSQKAGAFKSVDDLQSPHKVQLQLTYHAILPVSKGGLGGYVLGDTGIIVLNGAKHARYERIKAARAAGEKVSEADEALYQMLTRWNQVLQNMKQGGQVAEAVVLGNGQLAVVPSGAPLNARNNKNLETRTVKGDLITVNIDHVATIAMPPKFIDTVTARGPDKR